MTKAPKSPTKAAIEARPTVVTDDVFAGRSFWQSSSESQEPPQGDNRYRVNRSAKFYVVQLIGTWVHISESAERTVRSRNGLRWVTFESKEYQLKRAEQFKPFIARFVQGGCYARVGGKEVETEKEVNKLAAHPFIYIASSEALRIFNEMWQKRKGSKQS